MNPRILAAAWSIATIAVMAVEPTVAQVAQSRDTGDTEDIVSHWQRLHDTKADSLDAFNEAKFGMFIHWGLYADPAGVWKNAKMEEGGVGPTVAEWVMRRKSIPRDEYAELAKQFNPVKFDADQWARTAANAGMRYMVVTSKHHDGFALFDSTVSDFNIVSATPFRRDVIRELHDACARQDIRFGVYYSHGLDWRDGGDYGRSDYGNQAKGLLKIAPNDWDPSTKSFDEYLRTKALPQVEELVRGHPDLFMIWFDGAGFLPERRSMDFYQTIYRHAPKTLVNSRISSKLLPRDLGDYQSSGDNHIPDAEEIAMGHWETCGTMNNSWGYKSYDHDWKSSPEVLSWLVDVVSRGGNYLLNVGPTAEGVIPTESVKILAEVGQWLCVNGEAIYGTRAWTTFREGPTVVSRKGTGAREKQGFDVSFKPQDFWFTRKGGKVYAIALVRAEGNTVTIKSIKGLPITGMRVLGENGKVQWTHQADAVEIKLPPLENGTPGYALEISM